MTYPVTMLTSRWILESDSPFNSGRDSIDELNAWSVYCLLKKGIAIAVQWMLGELLNLIETAV